MSFVMPPPTVTRVFIGGGEEVLWPGRRTTWAADELFYPVKFERFLIATKEGDEVPSWRVEVHVARLAGFEVDYGLGIVFERGTKLQDLDPLYGRGFMVDVGQSVEIELTNTGSRPITARLGYLGIARSDDVAKAREP